MLIGFGWGHLNIRIRLEDINVDGRIILKWLLNRMGGCGLRSAGTV